ncbi:hypothetical protein KGQ20_45500, partial [Catenulispora sp. NF23]|nr:hypothetical protein [Catenulispora pinistramenti]
MNEPSSNAGGVGGLGDNGANEAADQDVRASFGANPAAPSGSGAQDPQAMPPQQDALPPTAASQPVPGEPDATLIQPAVPAPPAPAAGGYQAQSGPAPQAPQPQAQPQPPIPPQTQPGAAFGQGAPGQQAPQPGLG